MRYGEERSEALEVAATLNRTKVSQSLDCCCCCCCFVKGGYVVVHALTT